MHKKLFRALLTALFVLAIAVPVFAQDDSMAMGEGIECPEEAGTVTIAGGSVGAELEQIQSAADIFMDACPEVTIEVLEMPDSATERLNIYLQTWEAQSDTIDVFQVDVIWPAIIEPHVVDMSEYMTDEEVGMYFPDMIAGQTVDGKLVAIPWFSDAAGLYYRTDLLEEYGVDVPQTWDELTTAAQTVQEAHRAVTGNEDFWGYVWQGNDYEGLTCDAHEWLVSDTGDTFIDSEGEPNVNNELFIEAVERAAGWVGTISPPGVTTYQEEDSRNVFQAGNAAFMRNWPYAYNLGKAEDSPIADNFDWVPLPMGAERRAACLGGWQVAVSQYSDNIEASVAVAKYLAGPEQQKIRALDIGQLPTIPSLYEDEDVQADPLISRAGPILATAFARPSVATGASYNEASAIFSSGVHSVLTGEAEAADAMAELEIALEEFLAELEAGSDE